VEIDGAAIRDVLELTRDEVRKSGARVLESLRRDGRGIIAKLDDDTSAYRMHD
jgi:hypothetical protein